MGKILAITFNEVGRTKLCGVLGFVNWLSIFAAVTFIGFGIYIRLSLRDYIELVDDYDDQTLPSLLIAVGIISLLSSGLAGGIFFTIINPSKRPCMVRLLFVYIFLDSLLCVMILTAGILCFQHITHLEKSFHGGFGSAIGIYKADIRTKLVLDHVQVQYRCCGGRNYTDWFMKRWIAEEYLSDIPFKQERKFANVTNNHNVPFSCCDIQAMRPCIYSDILQKDRFTNLTLDLTIYQKGCVDVLMKYFGDVVLVNIGGIVFGIFGLKIVMILLSRILQTAMSSAVQKSDNPIYPSTAYLFKWGSTDDTDLDDSGWPSDEFDDNGDGEEGIYDEISLDDLTPGVTTEGEGYTSKGQSSDQGPLLKIGGKNRRATPQNITSQAIKQQRTPSQTKNIRGKAYPEQSVYMSMTKRQNGPSGYVPFDPASPKTPQVQSKSARSVPVNLAKTNIRNQARPARSQPTKGGQRITQPIISKEGKRTLSPSNQKVSSNSAKRIYDNNVNVARMKSAEPFQAEMYKSQAGVQTRKLAPGVVSPPSYSNVTSKRGPQVSVGKTATNTNKIMQKMPQNKVAKTSSRVAVGKTRGQQVVAMTKKQQKPAGSTQTANAVKFTASTKQILSNSAVNQNIRQASMIKKSYNKQGAVKLAAQQQRKPAMKNTVTNYFEVMPTEEVGQLFDGKIQKEFAVINHDRGDFQFAQPLSPAVCPENAQVKEFTSTFHPNSLVESTKPKVYASVHHIKKTKSHPPTKHIILKKGEASLGKSASAGPLFQGQALFKQLSGRNRMANNSLYDGSSRGSNSEFDNFQYLPSLPLKSAKQELCKRHSQTTILCQSSPAVFHPVVCEKTASANDPDLQDRTKVSCMVSDIERGNLLTPEIKIKKQEACGAKNLFLGQGEEDGLASSFNVDNKSGNENLLCQCEAPVFQNTLTKNIELNFGFNRRGLDRVSSLKLVRQKSSPTMISEKLVEHRQAQIKVFPNPSLNSKCNEPRFSNKIFTESCFLNEKREEPHFFDGKFNEPHLVENTCSSLMCTPTMSGYSHTDINYEQTNVVNSIKCKGLTSRVTSLGPKQESDCTTLAEYFKNTKFLSAYKKSLNKMLVDSGELLDHANAAVCTDGKVSNEIGRTPNINEKVQWFHMPKQPTAH